MQNKNKIYSYCLFLSFLIFAVSGFSQEECPSLCFNEIQSDSEFQDRIEDIRLETRDKDILAFVFQCRYQINGETVYNYVEHYYEFKGTVPVYDFPPNQDCRVTTMVYRPKCSNQYQTAPPKDVTKEAYTQKIPLIFVDCNDPHIDNYGPMKNENPVWECDITFDCDCPDPDKDTDGDGIPDCIDPCNNGPNNCDFDGDGIGYDCDEDEQGEDHEDDDSDEILNIDDKCPCGPDDADMDGKIDCIDDECIDGPDENDIDKDGIPDACDIEEPCSAYILFSDDVDFTIALGDCDENSRCLQEPYKIYANTFGDEFNFNWSTGQKDTTDLASLEIACPDTYCVTVTSNEVECEESVKCFTLATTCEVAAVDPNEITGPQGHADPKFIAASQNLPYTIFFENDPEFATAPARQVEINLPLDDNINPYSLELSSISFANMEFEIPEGRNFYSTRLDVTDSLGVLVDVIAGIDVNKNQAFWIMESVDPVTGTTPTDPFVGMLPVNDTLSRRGEGFVSFTMKAANNAPTGDTIFAKADIIFDDNEIIATNEVFNTIDALPPTSAVTALPATTSDTTFTISWTGEDDTEGSGLKEYTLYMSKDSAAYQILQSQLTSTSYEFTGEQGATYNFFTLATDHVGNQEAFKTTADATIMIEAAEPLAVEWLVFQVNPIDDAILLQWESIFSKGINTYTVQRSTNAKDFEDIHHIAGEESLKLKKYQFVDDNTTWEQLYYYRLALQHPDGRISYSEIKTAKISKALQLSVFPNPTTGMLNLQLFSPELKSANLQLHNETGQAILTQKVDFVKGQNLKKLDLSALPKGMYYLRLSYQDGVFVKKVVLL